MFYAQVSKREKKRAREKVRERGSEKQRETETQRDIGESGIAISSVMCP